MSRRCTSSCSKTFPENFLLSTGETHSIRDFLNVASTTLVLLIGKKHVYLDPAFNRPSELFCLQGSCQKAQDKLKWRPTVGFEELVRMMVDADLARLRAAAEDRGMNMAARDSRPIGLSHRAPVLGIRALGLQRRASTLPSA